MKPHRIPVHVDVFTTRPDHVYDRIDRSLLSAGAQSDYPARFDDRLRAIGG